jgi:serine/threonine protein kinase
MALKGIVRNRYQIVEEIGRGGFGIAYRARDLLVGRDVVLKQLHEQFANDDTNPKARRLFETEWQSLARLSEHPNIVHLTDLLRDENAFVMQYISGGNLTELIKGRGKLPLLQAVVVMSEVCDGLAAAHRLNIVHRDIKPSNILLTSDGHAKISDFGIAHQPHAGREVDLTVSGSNLGTINYMAPEQARGDNRITPAADIYSVGATLYAAITGRYYLPFRAVKSDFDFETMAYNFKLVRERAPEKPRRYNPYSPPSLDAIVLKCLEKEPKERYPSADEVSAALKRVRTMLENERDKAYAEGESALGLGKWAAALKAYDKVLAIDEDYLETRAHREMARKWLGSDEEEFSPAKEADRSLPPSPVRPNVLPSQLPVNVNPLEEINSPQVAEQPVQPPSNGAPVMPFRRYSDLSPNYVQNQVQNYSSPVFPDKVEKSLEIGPFLVVPEQNGHTVPHEENGFKIWPAQLNGAPDLLDDYSDNEDVPPVIMPPRRRSRTPWWIFALFAAVFLGIALAITGFILLVGNNGQKATPTATVAVITATEIIPTATTAPVIQVPTSTPNLDATATALATTAALSPTSTTTAGTPRVPIVIRSLLTSRFQNNAGGVNQDTFENSDTIYLIIEITEGNPGDELVLEAGAAANQPPGWKQTARINQPSGVVYFSKNPGQLSPGNYELNVKFGDKVIAGPVTFKVLPQPSPTPRPTTTRPVTTTAPVTAVTTTLATTTVVTTTPATTTVVTTTASTTTTTTATGTATSITSTTAATTTPAVTTTTVSTSGTPSVSTASGGTSTTPAISTTPPATTTK